MEELPVMGKTEVKEFCRSNHDQIKGELLRNQKQNIINFVWTKRRGNRCNYNTCETSTLKKQMKITSPSVGPSLQHQQHGSTLYSRVSSGDRTKLCGSNDTQTTLRFSRYLTKPDANKQTQFQDLSNKLCNMLTTSHSCKRAIKLSEHIV